MIRERWEVGPSAARDRRAWRVKRNGAVMGYCDTQRDAIDLATGLCRKRWKELQHTAELVIKGRDGRVRDARTYGRDPRRSKG